MPSDKIQIDAINFPEAVAALREAPELAKRFVASEMSRFGKRFTKKFIRERMSGRPGLQWTKTKVGKNVRALTLGKTLADLRFETRISRLLRVHEEGGTITAQAGQWLYLRRKTGVGGQGEIFAKVRSVRIPARLGFQPMAEREIRTDLVPRIHKSFHRAMRVAMERRMKSIVATVSRLASAG